MFYGSTAGTDGPSLGVRSLGGGLEKRHTNGNEWERMGTNGNERERMGTNGNEWELTGMSESTAVH